MNLKKGIGAVVLAGAAIGSGAQAQSTSVVQPGVKAATNNSLALPPLQQKTTIGGIEFTGGIEHSEELGSIIRAGGASRIGDNGAVFTEIAVGPKNRELFMQAGIDVGSNTIVSLTFQNLEQLRNFAFQSGKTDEWVSHRAIGAGARFTVDSRFIKYLELQGYQIDAQSQDLVDKEFTVDTTKIFQIFSDPRKLAGSVTNGAKGIVRFGSANNEYTLDLEAGVEKIEYKTSLATPSTTRGVSGAKLAYHPSANEEIYIRANQSVGVETTNSEIGWKNRHVTVFYNNTNGGTTGIQVNIPLDSHFKKSNNVSSQPVGFKNTASEDSIPKRTITYSEFIASNPNWDAELQKIADNDRTANKGNKTNNTNNILRFVQEKASWIPRNVTGVSIDTTANPKLIMSVDTTALPVNATLDKKTGDITMNEALGFGTLISATNTTNGQTLPSGSFTLGANTLTIHPRVLESVLSAGNNTITIDTTLATTTLIVQKGSVKILSISVTRKILNTILVPGAITCTTTTITKTTGTTCSITPVDPQGVATVTATFRGANVVVTKTGETYSTASLTSTTVGVFPVIWSITGKNPDGTNEAPQTVQQDITVTMPANVPGTIAAPTLESKTSTSINTTPGAVTGMNNVRVELYSNPELTNLVGTQASGDFSSLNPSTTYYAVTVGDDVNENTEIMETKRSGVLAIITDVAPDSTPNAFSFVDQSGVAVSSTITSAAVTIGGINMASPVSVSGGEYSINGGAWTSAAGSITNGQNIAVRGTSSGSNSTTTQVTLTVGGVSDSFDITTEAAADPMPTGGTLSDLTMNDEDPINYNAGGVTDSQSRTITYSASGLPSGMSINPSTGIITGGYDASGSFEVFSITVTATPAGGSNPLVRTFTLTINNTI